MGKVLHCYLKGAKAVKAVLPNAGGEEGVHTAKVVDEGFLKFSR
jgi:hypothetical protein